MVASRPRVEDQSNLRYEIKTVCQAAAYSWVRMHLRLDQACISELYPPRRVQSIYFDSLHQTALEDNLAGISHREKLRFRWYGEEARGVTGKLEKKVRHNLLGWKDILDVSEPVDVEGATRAEIARAVFDQLGSRAHGLSRQFLMPVQWISYSREYLATANGAVRVTIDRDLKAYDLRSRLRAVREFPTPLPDVMIIEAKCAKAAYREARRLIDSFPLRVDKCSKFVFASQPASGLEPSLYPIWR